ncbi:MAG: hypothetical protein WD060_04755 [Pirellulales bacterium]
MRVIRTLASIENLLFSQASMSAAGVPRKPGPQAMGLRVATVTVA